jgi:hypothetical protein
MRFLGVFNRSGLNKIILKRVKEGDFEFDDGTTTPISLRELKSYLNVEDLASKLTYAYIQQIAINEEI